MKSTSVPATRKYAAALALAMIVALLGATGALAAGAGSLDASFGVSGAAITDLGSAVDSGEAIAVQPDGKILVLATTPPDSTNPYPRVPILLRYNVNGTLDTAFGTNGRVTTQTANFRGLRVAVQPDGKILVCGRMGNDFAVARYNSNGTLNMIFGTNGIATVHILDDSTETCTGIAIQSDGKIVAAGYQEIGNYVNYAIARFNANGTPDLTFNDRGFQIVMDFPNNRYNYAWGVAIQGNGKIVMSGSMQDNDGNGPWATLARFNTDGSLDTTFGTGGMVVGKAGNIQSRTGSLVLQQDGKIVVAGTHFRDPLQTAMDLAVERFNTNGSLDTTFGGTGLVISDFGGDEEGHGLALQGDGKLVVVGRTMSAFTPYFLLARYNSNGTLDAAFGTNGKVINNFGSGAQSGNAVAIQQDGKILEAGSGNGNVVLARYYAVNPNITPVSVTFRSVGANDGWILESGEFSNVGGTRNVPATTFNLGDDVRDRQFRSILSFNTAPLPNNAVITGAKLRIKRQGVVGTDPFTTHGPLLLSIRTGAFSNNLALQLVDFAALASTGSTRDTFHALTYSWYEAALSNTNLAYIQKVGVTQFRLQFTKDDNDDMSADYVKMFSGNALFDNQPQLLITYYLP